MAKKKNKKMTLKLKKKESKKAMKSILKNEKLLKLFATAFMCPDMKKKKVKKMLKAIIKTIADNRHVSFSEDSVQFFENMSKEKRAEIDRRKHAEELLD